MKLSPLLVSLAVLSGGFVALSSPAQADTSAALPLTSFSDIVVDAAHGKVFLSGGTVVMTDVAGSSVTTISGITDARQMTLSGDGTELVVAAGDGLAVVDAATGTLDRTISTGINSCPDGIAPASGLVFFSYGDCLGGSPNLGAVDLATSHVTKGLSPLVAPIRSAQLASAPGALNMLALASGSRLYILDTTGGASPAAAFRVQRDLSYDIADVALDPGGTSVIVALPGTHDEDAYTTSGLSLLWSYGEPGVPSAVAIRNDGMLAIGFASDRTDAFTYSAIRGDKRGYVDFGPAGTTLATRGLAFGQNLLYGVSAASGGYTLVSRVAGGPAAVRIATDHHLYPYRATAAVTISLLSDTSTRQVTLWANTPGHTPHLVRSASVGASSHTAVIRVPALTRNMTFTAKFAGDDRYLAKSTVVSVFVRSKVTMNSASKSMSGSYHRLPATPAPLVTGLMSPVVPGTCVMANGYVLAGGSWHRVGKSSCLRVSATGHVGIKLIGFPRGSKIKLQMSAVDTPYNHASYWAIYYVQLT